MNSQYSEVDVTPIGHRKLSSVSDDLSCRIYIYDDQRRNITNKHNLDKRQRINNIRALAKQSSVLNITVLRHHNAICAYQAYSEN